MSKRILFLTLAFIVLLCVGLGLLTAIEAFHSFPERHARNCLKVITQVADRAVNEEIRQGHFGQAIALAEYVETYYPVGTVLDADEPFAAEYDRERNLQMDRVVRALVDATGVDHGRNWEEWREELHISP